jgi:hypothetical protein
MPWLLGQHNFKNKQSLFVVVLPMLPLDTQMPATATVAFTWIGSFVSTTLELNNPYVLLC